MFMQDGATLMELNVNGQDKFDGLAAWRPKVKYHKIVLDEEQKDYDGHFMLQQQTIEEVTNLVQKTLSK